MPALSLAGASPEEMLRTYCPMEPGSRWVHETHIITTVSDSELNVTDIQEVKGIITTRVRKMFGDDTPVENALIYERELDGTDLLTGKPYKYWVESIYSKTVDSLLMHKYRVSYTHAAQRISAEQNPPSVLFNFSKIAASEPYSTRTDFNNVVYELVAEEYEYVTMKTALGKHANVLKITKRGSISGQLTAASQVNIKRGTAIETYWLAPDKGLVRQEQNYTMVIDANGDEITSIETVRMVVKDAVIVPPPVETKEDN